MFELKIDIDDVYYTSQYNGINVGYNQKRLKSKVLVDGSDTISHFKVKTDSPWIEIQRIRNDVTIVVRKNESLDSRCGIVEFTHDMISWLFVRFTITQPPCPYAISVDKNHIEFDDLLEKNDYDSENAVITVTTYDGMCDFGIGPIAEYARNFEYTKYQTGEILLANDSYYTKNFVKYDNGYTIAACVGYYAKDYAKYDAGDIIPAHMDYYVVDIHTGRLTNGVDFPFDIEVKPGDNYYYEHTDAYAFVDNQTSVTVGPGDNFWYWDKTYEKHTVTIGPTIMVGRYDDFYYYELPDKYRYGEKILAGQKYCHYENGKYSIITAETDITIPDNDNEFYRFSNDFTILYDRGLKLEKSGNKTLVITNYGKVCLYDDFYYIITLYHINNPSSVAQIRIDYDNAYTNNETGFSFSDNDEQDT